MKLFFAAAMTALLVCLPPSTQASDQPASDDGPIPQTEQTDVMVMPPMTPHRVLVTDGAFVHSKDGRIYIVDGDAGRMLGMMPAAYNANVVSDPNGRRYYIGETIWTRGNRGTRQDLLSIYDTHTLQLTDEISLPGRALITTKKQDLDVSADGHWVYVYNMTPSSSVIVVDTTAKKVAASIDVPGCGMAFAWGNSGFTAICANGGLTNVAFTDPLHPTVTHTGPFFSPTADPVFEQSPTERTTGRTLFISYTGLVTPALLGAVPRLGASWSIQQAAGQPRAPGAEAAFARAWRPGGWQIAAWHHADNHLFVLMHQGTFWSHKADGTEVWELDAGTHKLLRRIVLPFPSNLVGVTQDAHPLLMIASDAGAFVTLDPSTGHVVRQIGKLGDNLLFTTVQGE